MGTSRCVKFYNVPKQKKPREKKGFGIRAFESRLRWQAHFIQKFEMECRMEHESIIGDTMY